MYLYIQIIIIKLYILNLILIFPTPSPNTTTTIPASYMGLKKTDSEKIRKALDLVNWEIIFNIKNIDTQVSF